MNYSLAETSPEIRNRGEFSLLCNWRNLKSAVEVGVDRASFAVEFLRRWNGSLWVGIDPYLPFDDMPWSRDCDRQMAVANLVEFSDRANLFPVSSSEFIEKLKTTKTGCFQGKLFDFVYIDANHSEESVRKDVEGWWPHVSQNGIIAGHDFDSEHHGVVSAVTEFARKTNSRVYLTQDEPASWYIYKSGIPGQDWKRIGK